MKCVELTGKQIGWLTVIRRGQMRSTGKANQLRTTWVCRCKCGKELEILTSGLTKNKPTLSCQACQYALRKRYNFVDLTGRSFGSLFVTALSEHKTKTRGALWHCKCSCGSEIMVASNSLTSGTTATCGNRNRHSRSIGRAGEIPLSHVNQIKQNAIKRGLSFDLTADYLWGLFLKQNRQCALSGVLLSFTDDSRDPSKHRHETTASLDRIDSNKGYDENNVRWVHKDVNKMRSNHSDGKFLEWCWLCITQSIAKCSGLGKRDKRFLQVARLISSFSKDPSTRVGAVIVRPDGTIAGTGYNGFVKGANDSPELYTNRDEKLSRIIHAEVNALIHAYVDVKDCVLYTWPFAPCDRCVVQMLQAGIIRFVWPAATPDLLHRWGTAINRTKKYLEELNIPFAEL